MQQSASAFARCCTAQYSRLRPLGIVMRWIHSGQMMTSQEVATALRPFIFIVHPDRFWGYPKEKNTNEVSLKKLNEFLGDRLSQKKTPEQTITFYMRNSEKCTKSEDDIKLKKVDIKLSNGDNLNTTVHRYLAGFCLVCAS